MERAATRSLAEAAALARIREMRDRRNDMVEARHAADGDRELKAATREVWALGDYRRFARDLVWELGAVLVDACEIAPGQRVLDVAAGTGNTAIRAAEVGAHVVASDLTPESLEAGRRDAEARGLELEWVEADAEALPFDDAEFDVVTSSIGAMWAPRHQAVADELVRVCRPGGTIGMVNFTPEGLLSDFLAVFAPYAPPPPPHASPPTQWGSEEHVRRLFGPRVELTALSRAEYVERAESPEAYREYYKETFGPVIATYAGLAGDAPKTAALDRDFLDFATRANVGSPGGPAEYRYEYLLVVGRRVT